MHIQKITYIGHSGFIVETKQCALIFDYYQGDLPEFPIETAVYVFVSHKHADHFNPAIFALTERYPQIHYILSYDIHLNAHKQKKLGISDEAMTQIQIVRADETHSLSLSDGQLLVKTLHSTDSGVAFLLDLQGTVIYHAGDLNWWYWKEESKASNNNMTADFKREMEKLKGCSIDFAFVPLDPRQEEDYYRGMEYFLQTAKVKYIFPMHMWEDYSVIDRFKQEHSDCMGNCQIMDIDHAGQHFIF